jgi:hypothetical protein
LGVKGGNERNFLKRRAPIRGEREREREREREEKLLHACHKLIAITSFVEK